MKLLTFFMLIFFIFFIFVSVPVASFRYYYGNQIVEDKIIDNLNDVANSKAGRISNYLDSKKRDAIFLSETESIKNMFDEDLIYDVGLLTKKIENIAKKTILEIEEYILDYPDATLEDLKKDEIFQSIAVQRVGDTGYTMVADTGGINYFHFDSYVVGSNLRDLEEEYPEFWEVFSGSFLGENSGFYIWRDIYGVDRSKFMYCELMPNIKLLPNGKLIVCATTYVDEYGGSIQLTSDLDFNLRSFQKTKGYADLIFMNKRGDVIWTAQEHNELGTNLVAGVYNDSLLAKIYEKTITDLGVGVADPGYYEVEGKIVSFVTSPIFEKNKTTGKRELLGVVALQLNADELEQKVFHEHGKERLFDTYIINRNHNEITPARYNGNIKKESKEPFSIFSEGITDCFNSYDNYYLERQGYDLIEIKEHQRYENYAGIKVLGGNQYILESGWCVMAEDNVSSFFERFISGNEIILWTNLIFFVGLLASGLFLDYFFFVKGGKKI